MKFILLILAIYSVSLLAIPYSKIMELEFECDKRSGSACGALGKIYHKSGKVQAGRRKLIRGCNLQDYASCTSIGLIHVREERMDKGRPFLERACNNHYSRACTILKVLVINKSDATQLYRNACSAGDSMGCVENALVEYKEGSRARAKFIYKLMCDTRNNLEACANLGILNIADGNVDTGLRLLIDSCNRGLLVSCVEYAIWDYKHKDKKRALGNLHMACKKQEMSGCLALGEIAEDEGRMKDARALYNKACNNSSSKGCRKLVGL